METNQNKTVAIIGRPNVGKSTLFNRLIGKRQAIETPVPGTTRDRLFGEVKWLGKCFNLIDVAGVEYTPKTELEKNIQEGIDLAIEMSDLILFVVDWSDPDNQVDKIIASRLRRSKKKVIVAVNKADDLHKINQIEAFKRYGSFECIAVSAISGKNSGDLCDLIVKNLDNINNQQTDSELEKTKIAIIGRPNVGKSTLINNLVGHKVAVVSEMPGTTRDAVNHLIKFKGKNIEIIDTAGVRRRGKIKKDTPESFSILRAQKAILESDIVIVAIDAEEGLVSGEATIIDQAASLGKGIILIVNKIDLWPEENRQKYIANILNILQKKLNFTPWLPVIFISGKEKINLKPLLNQILTSNDNMNFQIPAKELREILEVAKSKNSQIGSIVDIKQTGVKPPTIELRYKNRLPHATQIRYLENQIRDVYPQNGVPILFKIKSTKES